LWLSHNFDTVILVQVIICSGISLGLLSVTVSGCLVGGEGGEEGKEGEEDFGRIGTDHC
jgi:hypothetical protein